MNPIKLRGERWGVSPTGQTRWGMRLTCEDHEDFHWTFDGPSWEPEEFETALMIAYGHACMEHPYVVVFQKFWDSP